MYITQPTPEVKLVDDFDFVFDSGQFMPITVDKLAGDTIEFEPDSVTVHLVRKPSLVDPEKTLPAEDITIFARHIISVQHRAREIALVPVDPAWQKTLLELGKTVQ